MASESTQGREILDAASTVGPSVSLIVQGATAADPAVAEPLAAARTDLLAIPGMARSSTRSAVPGGPSSPAGAALIAKDGDGFLVTATLQPDLADPWRNRHCRPPRTRLAALCVGHHRCRARRVRPGRRRHAGVRRDHRAGGEGPGHAARLIALPISLLVMVLVFGGFLAAGMPIAGAIASIGGALAVLLGFSYLIDLDAGVVNVVTVLGLGLCIDYGLLIVSRYREELRLHLDRGTTRSTKAARTDALVGTMRTAGRTVLFSGVTVAISLSGLLLFQAQDPAGGRRGRGQRRGRRPAGRADPGTRADRAGRWPGCCGPGCSTGCPGLRVLTRKLGDVAPEEGFFSRLARRTQRRPWLVVTGVVLLLAMLAAPALNLQLRNSGVELLPPGAPDRQFFDTLAQEYPASGIPAIQVVGQTSPEQMAGAGAGHPGPGRRRTGHPAAGGGRAARHGLGLHDRSRPGQRHGQVRGRDRPRQPARLPDLGDRARRPALVDFTHALAAQERRPRWPWSSWRRSCCCSSDRVGAGPDQGVDHERDLPRRLAGRAGLGVPGRQRRVAARGSAPPAGSRAIIPILVVRTRVRAGHGLRGVPAEPDQGVQGQAG